MEGTAEKAPKNKKTIWVAGGLVVALVLIVYFSFFYPPVSSDEGQGSIGAAKKYRSEQITDKDVQFANVEKADEATIKEMGTVAQNLAQAAVAMEAELAAGKYAIIAKEAAGALEQAALEAKRGYMAQELAVAAVAAARPYYQALQKVLDVKGVAADKYVALQPMASNATISANMATIYAATQSWLENKQVDAKSGNNLLNMSTAYSAAMKDAGPLSDKAAADLLAATAPLAQAALDMKSGKEFNQQAVSEMAVKLEIALKTGVPAAAPLLEQKLGIDAKGKELESQAMEAKAKQ